MDVDDTLPRFESIVAERTDELDGEDDNMAEL